MTVISGVYAESHTITFDNRCGYGTVRMPWLCSSIHVLIQYFQPTLKQNFQTLSTGGAYTHDGSFTAAIAYLDNGNCGGSGENCVSHKYASSRSVMLRRESLQVIVETSLINGGVSSTDLSLISPHAFQATTGSSMPLAL